MAYEQSLYKIHTDHLDEKWVKKENKKKNSKSKLKFIL